MKKLLNISDLNKKDFHIILDNAYKLSNKLDETLKGKNIGLIFEKNSTRTRLSFQVGIRQLSGNYIDIRLEELNLQRFETYEDTFAVMSCYLDCLVFRTTEHKKLNLSFKHFNKPILNALSDISHPCQAISDIYTLQEHFKRKDDFKIVWMGDLNNVLYSLVEAVNMMESTSIDIFTNELIYNENHTNIPSSSNIKYYFDLNDRVIENADCIMTDVYNSMNDKEDKESLLLKFQVNNNILSKMNNKAVFMHCLPAKINSEVTEDVLKSSKSIVLKQAKNRMVAQRGILKWLEI